MTSSQDITTVLREHRKFPPPEAFVAQANISAEEYDVMYRRSVEDPEGFWADLAEKELDWFQKWETVLEWNPPFAKWFVGGKINLAYNCLDRHVKTWRKNKAAIIWEGEPGDTRTLTYQQLLYEVQKFANVLRELDVNSGVRVAIYMPPPPLAR